MKLLVFILISGFCSFPALAAICPESTAKVMYVPHSFRSADGTILNGHLATPKNARGPFPVVLFFPGTGPFNRYANIPGEYTADSKPTLLFQGIEERLLDMGVATFLYDKRGISPNDLSFESNSIDKAIYSTATPTKLAEDAAAAYQHLKVLPEADPTRIALLGHSQGTFLALKVAESFSGIRSLVFLGSMNGPQRRLDYLQSVTFEIESLTLMDRNHDGMISKEEYLAIAPQMKHPILQIDTWPDLQKYCASNEDQLSIAKIREALDAEFQYEYAKEPPNEYEAEGMLIERTLPFCQKIHVFHGLADKITPVENATDLQQQCAGRGTPVASIHLYPGLGHAFSPGIGTQSWIPTWGPVRFNVLDDIVLETAFSLKIPVPSAHTLVADTTNAASLRTLIPTR